MVERKENRPQGLEGAPTTLAEKFRAVRLPSMVDDLDRTASLSFTKCCFDRLDKPGAVVFTDYQAIEDDEEVGAFVE